MHRYAVWLKYEASACWREDLWEGSEPVTSTARSAKRPSVNPSRSDAPRWIIKVTDHSLASRERAPLTSVRLTDAVGRALKQWPRSVRTPRTRHYCRRCFCSNDGKTKSYVGEEKPMMICLSSRDRARRLSWLLWLSFGGHVLVRLEPSHSRASAVARPILSPDSRSLFAAS